MERLTERNGLCVKSKFSGDFGSQNILHALADYEDAEEQGLLVRLPCKVGDVVYKVKNNADACCECNFFEAGYCCEEYCNNKDVEECYPIYPQYADKPLCEKHFYEVVEYKTSLEWIFINRKCFGKTVFLTKEEAEQALKQMKGE